MTDYTADQVIERWNARAQELGAYISEYGDLNKEVLLTPAILRTVGDVQGSQVLDAGCGEGFLSRLLARRGASVTAVDYSRELLEIARARTPEGMDIVYRHANIERLEGFRDGAFDIVVSCCVLMDVPDYRAALGELYRVLRSGGLFVLAITHPCFSSQGGWVRDAEGKKLYWKIDNYFHERGYEVDWPTGTEDRLIYFHRTLTSYYRAITAAGFRIQDLEEPKPTEEGIRKHPQFIDDFRMCHFLVFKLRKCLDSGQ